MSRPVRAKHPDQPGVALPGEYPLHSRPGEQLRPVQQAILDSLAAGGSRHAGPRPQRGLRFSRNARIHSRASGSWLVAAITSMAYA